MLSAILNDLPSSPPRLRRSTARGVLTRAGITVLGLCGAVIAVRAQVYRGTVVPEVRPPAPVELVGVRLLTFTFGREGPMDVPLRTAPVSGREYFLEADLSGIESASSVRFELVDAANRPLQGLTMWKASDGVNDGEFHGLITMPAQAFRFVAAGGLMTGGRFRTVEPGIVAPVATGPADDVVMVQGLAIDQMRQVSEMVGEYRQQWRDRAAAALAAHPDGVVALAHPAVSPIGYEPLANAAGATIGIRLRYSIRFPSTATIAAVPHVFPVYRRPEWRGLVTMVPLGGVIVPAPEVVGGQALEDVVRYRSPSTYRAGVTYGFTIDMVPDYAIRMPAGGVCLDLQKYGDRRVFDALIADTTPVPYTIAIADTGTTVTVPAFPPQRAFYQSLRDRATDCGR